MADGLGKSSDESGLDLDSLERILGDIDGCLRERGVRAWQSGDREEIAQVHQWLITFDEARVRLCALADVGALSRLGPQVNLEPESLAVELVPIEAVLEDSVAEAIEEVASVPPVANPEPALPVPTVPKPTEHKRSRSKDVERAIRAVSKVLDDDSDLSDPWIRRAKLCVLRGTMEEAKGAEHEYPILDQWWSQLQHTFEGDKFFGLNRQKKLPVDVWRDLALGFEIGALASRWAQSAQKPLGEEGGKLLENAKGVRDFLEWLLANLVLIAGDSAVTALRDDLAALGSERGTPYPPDPKKARERLRSMTHDFQTYHQRFVVNSGKRIQRESARAALSRLVEDGFDSTTFCQDLASAAVACLAAGIAPSDKTLRGMLGPYYHQLTGVMPASGLKLLDYLGEDQAALVASQIAADQAEDVGEEDASDAEHQQRLAELRDVIKDKTVLFVGGNKGQEQRRQKLIDALGVNLVWPDVEEDTKVSRIMHLTDSADIVVLLIRFCRHNYKEVIDYAAKSGKQVATLKAGLGIHRVVYDLHARLCRPQ